MNHYMGIDIGTSGCKAVVFDEAGGQAASAYREYDIISPKPGWAELDSDNVIDKCFEVITESARQVKNIRGLGISSQGEAFTPMDSQGRVLGNALVSSDIRAAEYAESFPKQFGEEKLYQITGHTAHPMFSLFKLLWLRDNQPDVWTKATKFLCFEDILQYRMGLNPAIGWPLAGRTMLFDVRKHTWSGEILEVAELSADKLARPLQSGTVVGKIPPKIAHRLNLTEDTFVVTGGHDQPCGALGAGVTEAGIAVYSTGTVECITPAFDEPIFTENLRKNNLCTYDHTVGGMYATVAFSLTGGNILKWFRDEFASQEVEKARETGGNVYELLLAAAGDKPSNLIALPYFTPTGTPYFDTDIKGAILGLRLSTTRGEIIRALLESVAFEMRLNLDILERSGCKVNELRAVGGGAKSELWTQLKADVIGKPITVLNVTEAGCLGVAILARSADTETPVKDIATQMTQTNRTSEPDSKRSEYYAERFGTYTKLYPTLKTLDL